ncbi:MAG: hypothetical protein WBQ76_08290 [Candidatus Korobacteraceae bacterium]
MSFTAAERLELRVAIVSRAIDEYNELDRIAGVIEDKAQKTAVASGAFLAAGLGLLTSDSPRNVLAGRVGLPAFIILFAIIGLLIVATGLCLLVTWARTFLLPTVEGMEKVTNDILALPAAEQTHEVMESFYCLQASIWGKALQGLKKNVHKRADWLRSGQIVFSTAVLGIAILLILTISKLMI